jgi:hypothetical protein
MAGIFQNIFGRSTDRKMAKELATEIARLLGSERKTNQRIIIGEPFCPYKIPMHTADFWCSLFVSDVSYVFSGNHRKPTAEIWKCVDFGVEMKTRCSGVLGAFRPDKRLLKVSEALGVDVFADADADEGFIAKALLREPVFEKLRGIDFFPILEFNLCPLRLIARSSLQSADHCAKQAQLFRNLIVLLFQEARQRQINS